MELFSKEELNAMMDVLRKGGDHTVTEEIETELASLNSRLIETDEKMRIIIEEEYNHIFRKIKSEIDRMAKRDEK